MINAIALINIKSNSGSIWKSSPPNIFNPKDAGNRLPINFKGFGKNSAGNISPVNNIDGMNKICPYIVMLDCDLTKLDSNTPRAELPKPITITPKKCNPIFCGRGTVNANLKCPEIDIVNWPQIDGITVIN